MIKDTLKPAADGEERTRGPFFTRGTRMSDEIKVTVVKYPDRENLVLRYKDPMTGKCPTKSAKTTDMRKRSRRLANGKTNCARGDTRCRAA